MRVFAIVLVLVSRVALAQMPHEDVERVRPELKEMRSSTTVDGKATQREVRTYDASGHVVRQVFTKPDGSLIAAWDFTWDAGGRLAMRKTAGATRMFTYRLDANGRIAERIMRDPSAPVGELYRDEYTYAPDGSVTIQTYRHYPKEGPYRSDVEVHDAKGRIDRRCYEHGGCSMYEYDAHGMISRVREQPKGDDHHYRVHTNTYDAAGRLVKRVIGGTEQTFTYNARGDVSEVIAKSGARTLYTYDYR